MLHHIIGKLWLYWPGIETSTYQKYRYESFSTDIYCITAWNLTENTGIDARYHTGTFTTEYVVSLDSRF